MKNLIIVAAVVALVAGVAIYKSRKKDDLPLSAQRAPADSAPAQASADDTDDDMLFLPRMVDLGSTTCIPCKQMKPILDELQKYYDGRAEIEFIDVKKNPNAYQLFKIKAIPTQIFYDSDDEEVWRHEGFLGKDEIMAKFKELGVK